MTKPKTMTVLDQFAVAALIGLLARRDSDIGIEGYIEEAYELAVKMQEEKREWDKVFADIAKEGIA